jgi:hypothetical protein
MLKKCFSVLLLLVAQMLYIRPDNGQRYITQKTYDFLTVNGVPYDAATRQFNLWPVYTYNNYPFILTAGQQGNGSFLMKTPYPFGALDLLPSDIKNIILGKMLFVLVD